MKKALILCTGNSCRSIMAEAIVNHELAGQVRAFSSGVAPSGFVNPSALETLERHGLPTAGLHSKTLDKLAGHDFDAVLTVCDHAREACPVFPGKTKRLHVSIEDPVGRGQEAFEAVFEDVYERVLPLLKDALR